MTLKLKNNKTSPHLTQKNFQSYVRQHKDDIEWREFSYMFCPIFIKVFSFDFWREIKDNIVWLFALDGLEYLKANDFIKYKELIDEVVIKMQKDFLIYSWCYDRRMTPNFKAFYEKQKRILEY